MAKGSTNVSELRPDPDPESGSGSDPAPLVDVPRRRGRAVKSTNTTAVKRAKGFTLLRSPEFEKGMKLWAFNHDVDQSEMLRELVYILLDAESGELTELPDAPGLGEFVVQRIMERRIADAAADE